MEGYSTSSYGDRFVDVYDDWYSQISDAAATADLLAELSDGTILELGSGTGRLLAPLAQRGRRVIGLDASLPMAVRASAAVPDAASVVAEMGRAPFAAGSFGCVFVAFNTLFNVADADDQAAVFVDVGRMLSPDGLMVVEAFVPGDGTGVDDRVEVVRMDVDRVTLRVSSTDFDRRTVSGHYVDLIHGEPVTLRPWHLLYASPHEVDAMARGAGLHLDARYSGWRREPFDDASDVHVSIYRRR